MPRGMNNYAFRVANFKKCAFTLAEVLITLGIIGVVAALTIPGLMNKINDKVTSTQKTVMEKKITDGLNLMSNKENGLNVTYNNTEEFVRALSKYLKIITICSNTELNKCFPYAKINYEAGGEVKSEELTSITSAQKLKLEGNWLDPAGFIMADGTSVIMSYNNDCGSMTNSNGQTAVDPDRPLKSIPTACIDGLYDNNGSRTPNLYGKDVQPFAVAKIGSSCLAEIAGICIATAPFVPTPITRADCNANKSAYGITECRNEDGDLWGGAMKACKEQGKRLPTEAELAQIASYLYNTSIGSTETKYNITLDTTKIPTALSGLGTSWYKLWSDQVYNSTYSYHRYFHSSYTARSYNVRYVADGRAICVGD